MNTKILVVAEMSFLWVSTVAITAAHNPGVPFSDIMVNTGVKSALAILILTTLLLLPVDVSGAEWPAAAGGLIVGSAMLVEGTAAAGAFTKLLGEVKP